MLELLENIDKYFGLIILIPVLIFLFKKRRKQDTQYLEKVKPAFYYWIAMSVLIFLPMVLLALVLLVQGRNDFVETMLVIGFIILIALIPALIYFMLYRKNNKTKNEVK